MKDITLNIVLEQPAAPAADNDGDGGDDSAMYKSRASLDDAASRSDESFTFEPSLTQSTSHGSRPVSSGLHSSTSSLAGTPSPSGVRRTILMSGPLSSLRDLGLKAAALRSPDHSLPPDARLRKDLDDRDVDDDDATAGEDDPGRPGDDYFGQNAQARLQIRSRKAALASLNAARTTKPRTASHQRETIAAARALIDALDAARQNGFKASLEEDPAEPGSPDVAQVSDITFALSPESKAERAQRRAEQMESSLSNMSAIISGVKDASLYLPALEASALDVRTWFVAVLELKYDMDPEEAMAAVKNWRLLGGRELRQADEQVFRGIFGAEVGWILFREVQSGARKSGEVLEPDIPAATPAERRVPWISADLVIHAFLGVAIFCAYTAYSTSGARYNGHDAAIHADRVAHGVAAFVFGWLFLMLYAGYYYS